VFVINFEVFQVGNPVGCLLIFRRPGEASDTLLTPCNPVGVGVAFAGGVANLSGGHIRCPININAAFASLSPPVTLSQSSDYPFFTIVGVGRITSTPPFTETFGNPVAYYTPNNAAAPGLGLFVPISNTPGLAVMTSRFNGVTNIGSVPFQPVAGGALQSWSAKHSGLLTVYTVTHSVGDVVLQSFAPREPVSFWTDGGVFWIGGSPLGSSFRGALDEVVIDPPDGGRPPTFIPIAMQ
jgi:hypothetical protein